VREFWIALVPFFEECQKIKDLPDQISAFKQQVKELDERCAVLERAAETQHKQRQQHSKSLEAKDREIAELKMLLRNADEKSTEERERYRVLLARHSASVRSTASQLLRGPHLSGNQLRKPNTVLRSSSSKKSLSPESKNLSLTNCS